MKLFILVLLGVVALASTASVNHQDRLPDFETIKQKIDERVRQIPEDKKTELLTQIINYLINDGERPAEMPPQATRAFERMPLEVRQQIAAYIQTLI
jgi:hypothetical protein